MLTSSPAAATASGNSQNRRLCPRQRRRPLAEDYHRWRHLLVQLDLSRRADCCRHRTSGLLMGRRPSRRLCTKAPTGALYHKSYTGSWSGWQYLGGALTSSPAAAAPGSGLIDVFVRGTDSGLWQKTYNGGWSGWTSIGGMSQIQTQTIYYVPQAGSAWANQGTAGTSYNAYVSTPSLFRIQSNGYPYWGDIGKNDFTYIPAGSATNNQNVASWEIGFHLPEYHPASASRKFGTKRVAVS